MQNFDPLTYPISYRRMQSVLLLKISLTKKRNGQMGRNEKQRIRRKETETVQYRHSVSGGFVFSSFPNKYTDTCVRHLVLY